MREMKIRLPTGGQNVGFINIFSASPDSAKDEIKPTKKSYEDMMENPLTVALLNYEEYEPTSGNIQKIENTQGYGRIAGGLPIDIFKQEIDNNDNPLTPLMIVGRGITSYTFKDYNVSNHRKYRYYIYFSSTTGTNELPRLEFTISTNWQQWSVTELHPTDSTMKNFTADATDVWLFNLNLESGSQTQNIAKNEIQTLGMFPRISQGRGNYVSGQISCLLGSDVYPACSNKGEGYTEIRKYSDNITSNQRVDMLKAWRKMVSSKNPKLLKDRAGQAFLVSLSEASNKPYDGVKWQPNTINFNWTQIGTLDDVTILGLGRDDINDWSSGSSGCGPCNLGTESIVIDIEKIMTDKY